jgi:hypothetical protein
MESKETCLEVRKTIEEAHEKYRDSAFKFIHSVRVTLQKLGYSSGYTCEELKDDEVTLVDVYVWINSDETHYCTFSFERKKDD